MTKTNYSNLNINPENDLNRYNNIRKVLEQFPTSKRPLFTYFLDKHDGFLYLSSMGIETYPAFAFHASADTLTTLTNHNFGDIRNNSRYKQDINFSKFKGLPYLDNANKTIYDFCIDCFKELNNNKLIDIANVQDCSFFITAKNELTKDPQNRAFGYLVHPNPLVRLDTKNLIQDMIPDFFKDFEKRLIQ